MPRRAAEASIYEISPFRPPVRLIRDVTPGGNIRVLMTNLLDARRYPGGAVRGVSITAAGGSRNLQAIKHRLRLEAPSGLTYLAFQRDFAAKVLADNLCQLLSAETEPPDAASRPIEPTPRVPSNQSSPAASWRSNTPETSYRPCSTPSHTPAATSSLSEVTPGHDASSRMMWQWCVSRSSSAVVIFASPKHAGPFPEGQVGGDHHAGVLIEL